MRRRDLVLLLPLALALLASAPSISSPAARRADAAQADSLDVPGSLAATADGDVYVSFGTDYAAAVVRRFSADGVVLARWEVSRGTNRFPDVAGAFDGGVYVAVSELDVVRHYSRDGELTGEWPVDGLQPAIATGAGNVTGGPGGEVYVLASSAGGGPDDPREVHRFGQLGDARGAFPVAASSSDLTVWAPAAGGEVDVFVAEGARDLDGPAFISRYRAGGAKVGEWAGGRQGMDVDLATNRIWLGELGSLGRFRRAQAYERDGTPGSRCDLTTFPIDLTVGQNGDLYILADEAPARNVSAVYRYHQDCTLVDTWDVERLNRFPAATPTDSVATETPSETPSVTSAPGASETPPATLVPETATPTGYPTWVTPCNATATNTPTGTITPTPVLYPRQWWLPIAWRNGG